MKVVVTGGLGFIGRAVSASLQELGHEVVVLDNRSRSDERVIAGVEILEADVRDTEAVTNAVRGADVVYHLAAVQGTGNFYRVPDLVLDVNLRGTLNVADACAGEGVRRLVFSSSSEVYGIPDRFPTPEDVPLQVPDVLNPRYSYGGSKIAGELIVINAARRAGFEFVVLRYHNVYGPAMGWDHVIPEFIRRLELGEEFTVQGDGEQARSFCFVDDAVRATVAAGIAPRAAGQILNIGNPKEEHTINELVALLSQISGKEIVPRHVPFEGEGTRRRVPDISRATDIIGFRPETPLEDGLRQTYDWYVPAIRRHALASAE